MRTAFLLSPVLLGCIAAFPAAAQPELQGVVVYERYADTIPVGSPHVLVGLASATGPAWADPRVITIFVPPQGADSLCVDLVSDDGRYNARFGFRRPRTTGRHTVRVPAEEVRQLREYGPARLAPLVYLSRSCRSGRREVILPAGWGAEASPHRLRVLLNAENVASVGVRPAGSREATRCERLRQPRQIAYKYACEIEVSTPAGLRPLTILRTSLSGSALRRITVTLWVDDGT
jgi:hypothetical protein